MKVYKYKGLSKLEIETICSRQIDDDTEIKRTVEKILTEVKLNGDEAIFKYAKQFDNVVLKKLFLDSEEIAAIASTISGEAKMAINVAFSNIEKFHKSQIKKESKVETMTGVVCWRETRAIERVGLYVPGGSAVLPSTFLMLATPAIIAGCKEVVICSPPQKDGKTNCYVAYCAQLLGIDRIYLIGGAQAIAAMAYGTETVPKVYKIFGPGNRYVTSAKMMLHNMVAIDMPAGPSEVLIIADDTAIPAFVAADLLAQAEHGIDSQTVLVATSTEIIDLVNSEIAVQVALLTRSQIATKALENSYAVLVTNLDEAMEFSNEYAPEHLILATDNHEILTPNIVNAGSVFLGNFTPESVGDYASGTNHTLPTSGFAKAYSGVSVDAFVKKITFQKLTKIGLENIANTVETLALAEGLDAHKNAVTIRLTGN
ncbi:histidinol dehydrogenase [Pedobacter sp. UYEF25]